MYPPTNSKPRPPQSRRSSSSLTTSTSIKFPSMLSNNNLNESLNSTNNRCKPPESPPIHSYDLHIPTSPQSPSEGRSNMNFNSPLNSGVVNNKSKTSALSNKFHSMRSLSSKLSSDCDEEEEEGIENENPFSGGRSRALSSGTRDSLARSYGPSQINTNIPTLDRKTLDLKNKVQLVELVEKADKMITETERELDMAAKIGRSLFEENISLKAQLESRALDSSQHRNSEIRERPSPSPYLSRHAKLPSLSSTPHLLHQSTSWGSSLSTSPTSPLRTLDRRHRLSSTTSISSVQSSPQKATNTPGITSPEQLGSLSRENYTLILKVNEVEEEKIEAEREWKRKVRKLEKELLAMRSELERVGERNIALEEEKTSTNLRGFESVGKGNSQEDSILAFNSQDDVTTPTPKRTSTIPTTPVSPLVDSDLNIAFGRNYPLQSILNPTNSSRRDPGSPGENFLPPQSLFDEFMSPVLPSLKSGIKDEKLDTLVIQLKMKVEELERTNEVFQEEQELLKMKLERAQRDAEESRRIYEELIESQEEAQLGWRDEPSLIGWRPDEAESPTRARNANYLPSFSPDSFRRRRKEKGRHSFPRTLGSELGSHWDDKSTSSRNSSFSGSDYDSDDSTSAPTTFSQNQALDVDQEDLNSSGYLNTSSSLFKRGALRFNGSPDNQEYENISQVIDDLPAKWEREDIEPTIIKHRRRKSSTLGPFKALAWNQDLLPEDDEEDDNELRKTIKGKGREIIADSNHPTMPENDEGEEIDFSRIGTGEWGEKRQEREKLLVYSGALGNNSLRNRRRFNQSSISSGSRREAAQSRREMALERLGLESPHGTSRFRYGSPDKDATFDDDDDDDDEEGEEEKEMSEYDYVDGERVRQGSYWPMTLRARYAPRMLGLRLADKAISTVVLLVNYIRFFLILSFAIFFALYQGPKTLGLIDPRRRLQ